MPRYLACAKLGPAALAARRAEGFAAGEATVRAVWTSVGAVVECVYFTPSSTEWDVVGIVEAPSADAAFAVASAVMASGAAQRCEAIELRTGAEADAAIALGATYRPPGGSA